MRSKEEGKLPYYGDEDAEFTPGHMAQLLIGRYFEIRETDKKGAREILENLARAYEIVDEAVTEAWLSGVDPKQLEVLEVDGIIEQLFRKYMLQD